MPARELKDRDIDELYGLEPVFEPGARDSGELAEFMSVQCPYCGESFETGVAGCTGQAAARDDQPAAPPGASTRDNAPNTGRCL